MREGLRSRKVLADSVPEKLEINDVVLNGDKGMCSVSSGLGSNDESSGCGTEKTQKEHVKKDCFSDEEMAVGYSVRLFVNNKGRKCPRKVNGCLQIQKNGKKEDLSGEVQFTGRVLRSSLKCNLPRGDDETKSIPKESGEMLVSKRKIKAEKEDADLVEVAEDKSKKRVKIGNVDPLQKGGSLKNKPQCKRGESATLNLDEPNQFGNVVTGQSRGKCHLSSNLKGGNGHVKVVSRKKVIQNRRKSSSMEANVRKNATLDDKRTLPVYMRLTNNSETKRFSPAENTSSINGHKDRPSTRKQLLREKIAEMLFTAGWTVDYRPRNNKDYNDAVYVSLDGKTHWSITLAYRRLKEHCEAGDGEDKVYKPGFKFTPIPEEEFNILTKVILNRRKGKEDTEHQGRKVGGNKKSVCKVKTGSAACLLGNSSKGKSKRKTINQDNSVVREYKRQKSHNRKRCAILVRNAEKKIDSENDGYIPYDGRRTLLAWMIDSGSVPLNSSVLYINPQKQRVLRQGRITRDGVHCDCCSEIVSISEFEAHARSKLSGALTNVYLERGTPFLNCLLESWNKQDESERKSFHFIDVNTEDPNDDTCGICGDGGDLVCCDSCPSTFHESCLDMKNFPSGDWNCFYCCCKFCGLVGGSTHEREENDDSTMSKLLTCRLCEEKYHNTCTKANGSVEYNLHDSGFCGEKCQELFERLEMLLGVKHFMQDGFSWTLVRRSDAVFNGSKMKTEAIESNSKLAVALLIMDECFLPIIDHRSGINMIHSVVYNRGSNFNRLNYSGFFTAILERGDEIISVASIRIRGNQLAEMPFIGTRYLYRRQGMCRRLLCGIESALCLLHVELLVIPAVSELRETWTSAFGFMPLEVKSRMNIKKMNLLVFPKVDMLQKKIKNQLNGESMDYKLGNCHTFNGMAKCFDQSSDFKVSGEFSDPKRCEMDGLAGCIEHEIGDLETSDPQLAQVAMNDTTDNENKDICQIKPDTVQSNLKDDIDAAYVKDTRCNKSSVSVEEPKLLSEGRDGIIENNVSGQSTAVQIINYKEKSKAQVDSICRDAECGSQPSRAASHVEDPDSRDLPRVGCASDLQIPNNPEPKFDQLPVECLSVESTQECVEPFKCCGSQLFPSAGVSSEGVLPTSNSGNRRAVDMVNSLTVGCDGESFGDCNMPCDDKVNASDTKICSQRPGINEVCHSARVAS